MASAIVPKIYDASLADEDLGISTEDAYAMAHAPGARRRLAGRHLRGAAVVGCLQVARQLTQEASRR